MLGTMNGQNRILIWQHPSSQFNSFKKVYQCAGWSVLEDSNKSEQVSKLALQRGRLVQKYEGKPHLDNLKRKRDTCCSQTIHGIFLSDKIAAAERFRGNDRGYCTPRDDVNHSKCNGNWLKQQLWMSKFWGLVQNYINCESTPRMVYKGHLYKWKLVRAFGTF